MKNFIFSVYTGFTTFVSLSVIFYLILSFAMWDYNPANWEYNNSCTTKERQMIAEKHSELVTKLASAKGQEEARPIIIAIHTLEDKCKVDNTPRVIFGLSLLAALLVGAIVGLHSNQE